MEFRDHYTSLKSNFSELDLLTESEFRLFDNEDFAKKCINYCLRLCNNARKFLDTDLFFGIQFNQKFNASAITRYDNAAITFNHGLIDKLGVIISNSIDLFISENIAQLTIQSDEIKELKQISFNCCISYLFYHELAHIIQLNGSIQNNNYDFQELYLKQSEYNSKKHAYEFDADLFGTMISAAELMKNIIDKNRQFNSVILFNSLTCLLFTIGNILIEFSGNLFQKIYYRSNSHPHPFLRILKINEQILGNIATNLNIEKPFFEATLGRVTKMISQIEYTNGRTLNYTNFYNNNSIDIEHYINGIETENERYSELTRYKSQKFYNNFIWSE